MSYKNVADTSPAVKKPSDGSRASSQMKSAIPFSGADQLLLGIMCGVKMVFFFGTWNFGWTVSAVCVFFWWNLVYICIICSIFFLNVFWRLVNFRVNPTLVDFWDSHSGSFGWKARIVSALSVPIGGENDRLRWLPNRYVFFCPRIETWSKQTLFGFGSISSMLWESIQWLFVEFNLFWSHLGAISCMPWRHTVSYLSLTLQGVQDKYSNLQKHAAAVSRWKSRVQEPYLDFFDLRHLLVPGVFRWTSSEGGRSKSLLHSFSCHILENIGPKALVFFFWGVSNQTCFLSEFSQNVRVSTFPSFEVLGT